MSYTVVYTYSRVLARRGYYALYRYIIYVHIAGFLTGADTVRYDNRGRNGSEEAKIRARWSGLVDNSDGTGDGVGPGGGDGATAAEGLVMGLVGRGHGVGERERK